MNRKVILWMYWFITFNCIQFWNYIQMPFFLIYNFESHTNKVYFKYTNNHKTYKKPYKKHIKFQITSKKIRHSFFIITKSNFRPSINQNHKQYRNDKINLENHKFKTRQESRINRQNQHTQPHAHARSRK